MTTLVTGATGFVGSAVARRLLEAGEAVRVLAREGSDRRNIEGLEVEVATGDLRDPASLKRALAGCRTLYHVAADYRLWIPRPDEIYETNVEGTRRLLLVAAEAGVERVVYTSSVATLGINRDGTPSDEATPVGLADMIGHYKRSKFLAEEEVKRLVADEGLPVVIVNPSTPIGPRDVKPTPTGRVIVEAASGRVPAFVDTGLNVVHVDDVAAGHLLAHAKGKIGERYVLGGQDMTLAEILAEVAGLVGRRAPRIKLPHGAILPLAYAAEAWARSFGLGREPFVTVDGLKMARKRMFFSSAKAARELGYQARPASEALSEAVAWFKAEGYLG
ncbi:MAG: hopanoid-associated sugar epimerase [Kiloniellales bacterium]